MSNWIKQKLIPTVLEALSFFVRKILLIDILLIGLVALSFLFIGEFSANSFSERLIWVGIAVGLAAGVMVSAQTTGGRDFGTPGQFVRTAHASTIIEWNIEVRKAIEAKMGIFPRIFLMGVILFIIGAVIQVLFGQ
jgi:hypothetical protein